MPVNQEKSGLDSISESNQNDQFSFVQTEHQILKFWSLNNIFKKSLEQTAHGQPYIFYDGPPFATGLPHHGHLVGSILKDIVPRYFTMKGRYVERRFGWDCHGLPIEHEIDKKLGMTAHDAVKKLGIKGYNDECRGIVQRYTQEWEKTITRIGRWVDFVNDYKTMDITFMESVWWVFKELWDKNLVYQGTKVVPFSTALGTVLSNFEAGLNYQDVQDPAITILFKLADEDAYMLAWTTTPWTLPSNLALCMGADIDYVKLRDKDLGKTLIMAQARVESYSKKRNLEILSTHKGSEFKGRRYEPLFPFFAHLAQEGAFVILNDSYVTTDDGTGIVHTAPAFGEDDNRVMREAGIKAIVCPVDDAGKFTKEVSDYQGQYVKDTDKEIIRTLKSRGQLYDQSTLVHSYPYCYRSDTPLIYKAIPSWYVNVEAIKDRLQTSNQKINWVPDHIKEGRFGKWLEGARDWAISRNRVWGTPLPVWINDVTNDRKCLGSCAELEQLTGTKITDLHRESVDNLSFTIKGQAGVYRRIPEVFDCWFESGSMPYAQLHYPFENQELFKNGFPAEFIAEGLDQTRGWFYTLTILSTALFNQPAFKNVIVNGMVLAEDGKKMSKRLKNYTPPDELMETFGADALRLYLITSGLVKAEEQRFADSGVKDMVRRALLPWYNAFKFFQTYAKIDGWNTQKFFKSSENITDRWLISNLQTLKTNISREMEVYHLYNVVPALLTFIEDLTNWYIRLNRSRFWDDQPTSDKWQAYSTLYTALLEISQAMAPFTPFLSEHMYQELTHFVTDGKKEESVHLCHYPVADEKLINPALEDAVSRMQQVILLGRQKRNQTHIKVKTPLRRLTIINKNEAILREMQKLEHYIQSELNIKTVEYSTKEDQFISFFAKPNSPILGKKLGKDFGRYKGLIEKLPQDQLVLFEETGRVAIQGHTFEKDEIFVYREALPGTNTLSNRLISIDLDMTMDQDLIDEGIAREVVNRIQRTRKDKKLNVEDRIQLWLHGDLEVTNAIKKHLSYITRETLATHVFLEPNDIHARSNALSFDIEGTKLELDLEKA
ncbi:MAG: isoleucine--tRNA ligase [Bdellovibrionales bacterium GWA2_49_15]|nr:MAG: isoleucine--tRNA ligase [Bdellovibrionales bacterium GWA2_49_15]